MASPNVDPGYSATAALTKIAWDTKLKEESSTGDIFSFSKGIFTESAKQVPDAVVMTIKGEVGETARTFAMLNRLSGAGLIGAAADLRGSEEIQTTREIKVFANEWFTGVPVESYGLKNVKQNPYGVYKMAQPQLSLWTKEMVGQKIRQALAEYADASLTTAAVGLGVTAAINPNVLVAGTAIPVAYSAIPATYVSAIEADLDADTAGQLTVDVLNKIEALAASVWEIDPLTIMGKEMWVLTVPTNQKAVLRTPAALSYFETLKDADVRGASNRALSGVLGSYGMLLLVEDQRAPKLLHAVAGTLTFSYKGPGQSDARPDAGVTVADVGFLLGKGAVVEYEIETQHFENEVQNYGRNKGIGTFQTTGYTRLDYANHSGTPVSGDTDIRCQSSAMILMNSAS